jgi:hypothetical protein
MKLAIQLAEQAMHDLGDPALTFQYVTAEL